MAGRRAWRGGRDGGGSQVRLTSLSSPPPRLSSGSSSHVEDIGTGTTGMCARLWQRVPCARHEGKRCDVEVGGGGAGRGTALEGGGAGGDAPLSVRERSSAVAADLLRKVYASAVRTAPLPRHMYCRERGDVGGHPQHVLRTASLHPRERDPATISSDSLKSRHCSLRNTPTLFARMSGITWPHSGRRPTRRPALFSHG